MARVTGSGGGDKRGGLESLRMDKDENSPSRGEITLKKPRMMNLGGRGRRVSERRYGVG